MAPGGDGALEPSRGTCVIVGGALVGCAAALALARAGTRVLMLDEHDTGTIPGGDVRPIALAAASRRILDDLGVWDALAPECQPILTVHVSQAGHLGRVRLEACDYGLPALGYVTDATSIARVLDQALADATQIERRRGVTVTALVHHGACVQLATRACTPVPPASLVVLASGSAQTLPGEGAAVAREHDYAQDAVVCNVVIGGDHQGVAYERFLDTGPLALLPLPDGRCGMVWTLPTERAARLAALGDDAFLAALQEAFGYRLGSLRGASARVRFPLTLATCGQPATERVVRIGNAANRLHPVAGQGFNLGLRDVATLAELVGKQCVPGAGHTGDPGCDRVLDRYLCARRSDQRATVALTHWLATGFSSSFAPLAGVRSLAMLGLQLMPAARHILARRAMGLAPPVPRAARGRW